MKAVSLAVLLLLPSLLQADGIVTGFTKTDVATFSDDGLFIKDLHIDKSVPSTGIELVDTREDGLVTIRFQGETYNVDPADLEMQEQVATTVGVPPKAPTVKSHRECSKIVMGIE